MGNKQSENSKKNAAGQNANAPRSGEHKDKKSTEKKGFSNMPPKHQNL